jgi:hypothetical protein
VTNRRKQLERGTAAIKELEKLDRPSEGARWLGDVTEAVERIEEFTQGKYTHMFPVRWLEARRKLQELSHYLNKILDAPIIQEQAAST